MSNGLELFMEKLVREVTDGVAVARRVKLIAEGNTYETWEPIQSAGIEPGVWAAQAENIIAALTTELPKKRIQLQFIAEDHAGATLSTHMRTVQGQNANAQDIGTQGGAKALSDAMAGVAKTMEATLDQARKMMEFQATQLDKAYAQINENHEVLLAIHKLELEEGETANALTQAFTEQFKDAAPLLLQLGQHWLSTATKKTTGGAVASVVTNGAH